jgi:preprotein translocase subunit SecF
MKIQQFSKYTMVVLSLLLVFIAICLFITKPKIGIDFTGGGIVTFSKDLNKNDSAKILSSFESGVQNNIIFDKNRVIFLVDNFDDFKNNYLIKFKEILLSGTLEVSAFDISKEDFIGAKFGLKSIVSSIISVIISLVSIFLYIAYKFNTKMGIFAAFGLLFNCLFVYCLTNLFGCEMSILSICAFLTLIGYCVNDTVVVFDRVRDEFFESMAKNINKFSIVSKATKKVLSRSIKTSVVTMMAIFPLFILSDGDMKVFSFIMILGIISGTMISLSTMPLFVNFFDLQFKGKNDKNSDIESDPMKYV